MSTVLDGLMMQRIAFLRELIRPGNRPEVNATFQLQVEILQTADIVRLGQSILMRKAHLKQAKRTSRKLTGLSASWMRLNGCGGK